MVQRGVEENKTLDQVIELIEAESEARDPLHEEDGTSQSEEVWVPL